MFVTRSMVGAAAIKWSPAASADPGALSAPKPLLSCFNRPTLEKVGFSFFR